MQRRSQILSCSHDCNTTARSVDSSATVVGRGLTLRPHHLTRRQRVTTDTASQPPSHLRPGGFFVSDQHLCAFDGCTRDRSNRRLMCEAHYYRIRRSSRRANDPVVGSHHVYSPDEFWKSLDKSGDCWLWRGKTYGGGYGYATVSGTEELRGHRIAWALANGEIPLGAHVLHSCDVKECCRPSHLRLGTHSDNMRDVWERIRVKKTR